MLFVRVKRVAMKFEKKKKHVKLDVLNKLLWSFPFLRHCSKVLGRIFRSIDFSSGSDNSYSSAVFDPRVDGSTIRVGSSTSCL